ncbi:MAG: MMPL family transporter [Proteobacteria bacterium]|nr:MMPL family transporter [Pseudomonadota bacterium]
MSAAPATTGSESRVQKIARFIVTQRAWVAVFLIASNLFFFYPILNAALTAAGIPLPGPAVRVDTEARAQWPDHPFIHAQDKFAGRFGTSSLVAIALVVKEDGAYSNIFSPETIAKINRITKRLDGRGYNSHTDEREELRYELEEQDLERKEIQKTLDQRYPPYPVNHYQINSVTHSGTRVIQIESTGDITSSLLMNEEPTTQEEAEAFGALVRQNPPFIYGRLVSRDQQGALITAGFVTDRLNSSETFRAVFNHVMKIKEGWSCEEEEIAEELCAEGDEWVVGWEPEEDANHDIFVSGGPILVGWILEIAFQIGLYVGLTIVTIFALLWVYFRRWHGVVIPMIAALSTVIWGLGFTGWVGITFDPLILVIPTIITARAISHTVQMAERFFEDYETMLPQIGDPQLAKVEVATVAMGELIVPGTLGIITDVAGLLVILVTSIPQLRDLGIFGAFWVASIIVTVEILHPVLICYLPAPKEHEHFLPNFMVRFTRALGNVTTHPRWKYVIAGGTIVLFVGSTYITLFYSQIGESRPGTPLLFPDHDWNVATAEIAKRFGGIDSLVIYADGDKKDASGDALPILRMEEFERWMETYTNLGTPVSVVPILRMAWRMNHYGDPKWLFVPKEQATVRQQLFQLRTNGPPGFLRPFMTDDGRDANISFYYPDHKGETIVRAVHASREFIKRNPIGEVIIRLDKDHAELDAPFFSYDSLVDKWYYMLDPLLPPRNHTLQVRIRGEDGTYSDREVHHRNGSLEMPEWIDEFRENAIYDYEDRRDSTEEDEVFTWPETLGDWDNESIDAWWEDKELGIRAIAVNTADLIVEDLKAIEGIPSYQPTNSWTRGVQFVMAGGLMGILAAINDEVERSHVANIVLIFLVIFVLHAVTFKSVPSGFIVLLQIMTATMLSLAYMAVAGLGLNINTLPVQSVGVGIGVDYAIYIVDRIRHEVVDTGDIDDAVRRAVRTTGMAVAFTATTIVGGIGLWSFSDLRFQAEMARLLSILMVINMFGALTVVPAFYSIMRPKVATALLSDEQLEALRMAREAERRKGLID